MSRCSRVLAPLLATMLLVPCLAQAQSQGGGYWDRGRWIGYMPAHVQNAKVADQFAGAAEAERPEAGGSEQESTPAVQAAVSPRPAAKSARPSAGDAQPVQQAQYTQSVPSRVPSYASPTVQPRSASRPATSAGAYRPRGAQMVVAQRQAGRGVARTSLEMVEPVPTEGPMVEGGPMAAPGSYGGCADCQGGYEGCADCGCNPCGCAPCGEYECGFFSVCRPQCFWGRAEYLGWWTSGMRLPPLVTTNPDAIPTLEDPDTVILFGNEEVNKDARSGGRFTLGMWLDPCATRGLDVTYFALGSQSTSYYADSDQYDRLGRPFYNIAGDGVHPGGVPDAELISYPDVATGSVSASAETKFQGIEVLLRRGVKRCPNSQVDLLIGWRWMQLKDNLFISQNVIQAPATELNLFDRFDTSNNFHGAEFGVEWERPLSCCWTLETVGKFAIGNTYSSVRINGSQTGDADQGLLALDSNSGTHKSASFASVVELGLSVKRRFTCGLEATFGYTLIYWGDVMRAGDQVDLNVDPRQVPPAPVAETHPEFLGRQTDFWAQGLNIGLEYAF